MSLPKRAQALVLSLAIVLATGQQQLNAYPVPQSTAQAVPRPVQQSPEQLQQLVAPIALYPDELVAQVLAASTYPAQIVEADRWLQQNSTLKGDQLATEVDKQPWDPSVKALAQFPSLIANMSKNLSWTSALGDAYFNQQQDVLNAVQVMRQRAQQAGNLKSTSQQAVTTQDQTIIIEPANPEVVYVPTYDPWAIYGPPIVAYPDYYEPGGFIGGSFISFSAGFAIGAAFGGYGWAWRSWGCDWHGHTIIYNHNRYVSRSTTFVNRNDFYRNHNNSNRGNQNFGRSAGMLNRANERNRQADRSFDKPRSQTGTRSGAFSGFDHGGNVRGFSARGRSSFGGGMHGGGGRHR
jgi:hypothetical protein